ncbi:MAG TPA: LPS assembly protein LptD [Opitutaceae bacterium]|nr:LPS assembly protein LptD [Opitutaceae bacterium]
MKLRQTLLVSSAALLALVRTLAADRAALDLTSATDKPIEFDYNTKEMVVLDARLTYGELTLTADEIRYNDQTKQAHARGHIVLTRGDIRLVADEGTYSLEDGKVRLQNTRAGYYPLYLQGRELEGNIQEFTLKDATLTYGEPGTLSPMLRAATLDFTQGKSFRAHGAHLRLGPIPLVPLPVFSQRLDTPPLDTDIRAGFRSSLGAFVDVTALAPVANGVKFGPELGLYSKRGLILGPAASYDTQRGESSFFGNLRSGWIYDLGSTTTRGLDIEGDQIGRNRGYIDWRHLQTYGEHLTFIGQLGYWSDSEIIRDFARQRFGRNQQPETFFELDYAGDNYIASAFVRAQPNDFQITQRRVPELRADLLATPIGAGVIERGSVGFVVLREDASTISPELSSERFDAYYGLERPTALTPWLTATPVVGTRLSHYFSPLGDRDTYTRVLGQFGGDLRGRAFGQFEYKNERWGIDGLRHLIEPFVQYRFIPDAEKGRQFIPDIDRTVFSTRLPTIDLADIRYLDDLREINTLRYGLEQRLQTRDGKGGVRDLIILTLAQDRHFNRLVAPYARTSDVHADIAFLPAAWIRFDAYQRFDPHNGRLDEFNSGVTITDSQFWTARFGTQFLRDELEEYNAALSVRLNERFTVTGLWRYDAIESQFYEQVYGLRQNFRNLWSIEYQVAFQQGQRRESGFQFRVQLEVFKF